MNAKNTSQLGTRTRKTLNMKKNSHILLLNQASIEINQHTIVKAKLMSQRHRLQSTAAEVVVLLLTACPLVHAVDMS
jgi:putative cell wall-binding protein